LREDLVIMNSQQTVPVHKWSNEKVHEWFSKKFPSHYESFKDYLTQNQLIGENLLDLNTNCFDQLGIIDGNIRFLF
jgi:hypothetical protein